MRGNCGIALPAYAIKPILSPFREKIISFTICFDLSSLLGEISSASILFETSTAKTTSTPILLKDSSFVPILGLIIAITKKNNAIILTINFAIGLMEERLGLSLFKFLFEKYNFCVFNFHL